MIWFLFITFVLLMLALVLGAFHRKEHVICVIALCKPPNIINKLNIDIDK
jgi:hypothetical protein